MIIEQGIEQYCQERAAKQGKEIGASARAYIENQKKLQLKKRKIWDTCFGCYNIVMSAFNGLVEDRFVDVKSLLMPNKAVRAEVEALFPMKKNHTKKTYRKYINGKLRERYPYFHPVVDEAVKNFDEQFFEKWASKSIHNAKSLIQEIVDKSIEGTRGKMTVLFYSVKNEMDKMRLPDTEIRARVYTLHLLADALEEVHLGFMLVGLVPDWVGITRNNDKFDLLQRINDIAKNNTESPYFDIVWKNAMNPAMPYWNVRYITAINTQVCGEWTHLQGGNVDVALRALKTLICSTRFMESVAYDGMMEDQNYEKELELINGLEMYTKGDVPVTLVHLQCVRMMLEGKSNDEIKKFLTCDDSIVISEEKLIQILVTVEILRRSEAGELDIDYYNKSVREFHDKPYERPEGGDRMTITSDTISEFGDGLIEALNVHRAEEAVHKAEEAIKNDPVNRLREKFGNVTTQKEKKQHPQYFHPKFKKADTPVVEKKRIEEAKPLPLEPQPAEPRRNATRWTPDEERYLEQSWGKVSIDEIQKHLWRTEASIRSKASRMMKKPKSNDPQLKFE